MIFSLTDNYFKWLRTRKTNIEDDTRKHGSPIIGTIIEFRCHVVNGFMDSGWQDDVIFVRRPVTKEEATEAVILHCSKCEVDQVSLDLHMEPYFGTEQWYRSVYR
jgi:hypothetical protein